MAYYVCICLPHYASLITGNFITAIRQRWRKIKQDQRYKKPWRNLDTAHYVLPPIIKLPDEPADYVTNCALKHPSYCTFSIN
jgi:hypothetical protein